VVVGDFPLLCLKWDVRVQRIGLRQGKQRMAGGKNKGYGGKGGMDLDDFRLWKEFTRDIDPLEDPDWEELEALIQAETPQPKPLAGTVGETPSFTLPEKQRSDYAAPPPQLDARTEQRLRRGKMPIEGTLDLHGRTQDQAHALLLDFIKSAHARGKRCLLIITGKGRSTAGGAIFDVPDGILKQRVPGWLSSPPLQHLILKVMPAVQGHGGSGALYVYLKRKR